MTPAPYAPAVFTVDAPPLDPRRELAALRAEVAEIRASWRDGWIDAARAEEIRGVVRDVLADSATRTSFADAGPETGYDHGAYVRSADGSWLIRANVMTQVRFVYASAFGPADRSTVEQDRWGFENRRTNFGLGGTAFDPSVTWNVLVSYQSETDRFVQTVNSLRPVLAWVRKDFGGGWWCTAGLQNVPWDLESTFYGSSRLTTGDYSVFNYRFGAGKQPGIEIGHRNGPLRGTAAIFTQISDLNEGWERDTNLSFGFATRHEVKLGADWAQLDTESSMPGSEPGVVAGLGFCWSGARGINPQPPASEATPAAAGFSADLRGVLGGATLIGQCSLMRDAVGAPALGWWFGANAQASVFVTDRLEAFAEACWMDGVSVPWIAQFGVNWMIGAPQLKLTAKVIVPFGPGDVNGIRQISGGLGMASQDGNASLVTQLQLSY